MFYVIFNNIFTIIFVLILIVLSYFSIKKLTTSKKEEFVKCYGCLKNCNKNIKK